MASLSLSNNFSIRLFLLSHNYKVLNPCDSMRKGKECREELAGRVNGDQITKNLECSPELLVVFKPISILCFRKINLQCLKETRIRGER